MEQRILIKHILSKTLHLKQFIDINRSSLKSRKYSPRENLYKINIIFLW